MGGRVRTSIDETVYREYLGHLLRGDLPHCRLLVQHLLQGGVPVETLYLRLLQRALYEVGDLWAVGSVCVAAEHMATAVTEDLMRMAYPLIISSPKTGRKAIVTCTPGEYHQVGGHMVADLMELAGWQVAFLGANTPIDSLVLLVEQFGPDLVGLSTTLPANLPVLHEAVEALSERFSSLSIAVGGQGVSQVMGPKLPPRARLIESVDQIHSL